MGLSEDEIEARLAGLRRQREALDREIADLVLYLELGRRLRGAGGVSAVPVHIPVSMPMPVSMPDLDSSSDRTDRTDRSEPGLPEAALRDVPASSDTGPPVAPGLAARNTASRAVPPLPSPLATPLATPLASPLARPLSPRREPDAIPPAIAFTEDAAGARRYGRALVAAACGAILAAGRPLHAGEILPILQARGFTLPGRDPVAALNTRLWKRAGPGGPLRRVAEATYALAGEAGARSGPDRDPDA